MPSRAPKRVSVAAIGTRPTCWRPAGSDPSQSLLVAFCEAQAPSSRAVRTGRASGSSVTFNHPTAAGFRRAIVEVASAFVVSTNSSPATPHGRFHHGVQVAAALISGSRDLPAKAESAATSSSESRPPNANVSSSHRRHGGSSNCGGFILRVVVNERTGTVVIGRNVPIRPVSIMHGGLSISVTTTYTASQPKPFSDGETVVVPQANVDAREASINTIDLKPGSTVEDLVRALAAIGSTPGCRVDYPGAESQRARPQLEVI